ATLPRYFYAAADPVNLVDPSGREFDLESLETSTIVQDVLSSIARADEFCRAVSATRALTYLVFAAGLATSLAAEADLVAFLGGPSGIGGGPKFALVLFTIRVPNSPDKLEVRYGSDGKNRIYTFALTSGQGEIRSSLNIYFPDLAKSELQVGGNFPLF